MKIADCKVGMEAWLKQGLNRFDRIKILDVLPDDNMVKIEFIDSKMWLLESPRNIRLIRFIDETTIKCAEPTTKEDKVNSPAHYTDGDIECIEAMEKIFGSKFTWHFCMGNAFKYNWRAKLKNGREDIKKACKYHELVKKSINKWAKKRKKKK